ncbi:hypothetical protein ACWDYH_12100 [Nocardia goodfellowii]
MPMRECRGFGPGRGGEFAEKTHNVAHWSEFFSGGHFPALEVPELLAGDIREFIGVARPVSRRR